MDYFTEGRAFHKGLKFQAFYTNTRLFDNCSDRYKILFIESGNLIIDFNDKKISIISPALIIQSEKDKVRVIEQNNITGQAFYFMPRIINKEFAVENINNEIIRDSFTDTVKQDFQLLKIFLTEGHEKKVFNSLHFEAVEKFKKLLLCMKSELVEQNDNWWTCSTRCYVIQFLFFMRRVSMTAMTANLPVNDASADDSVINKIILFLNSNYDKKIKLEEIARTFNTNRTSLNDIFKKNMNKTIIEYLIDLRFKIAQTMLHDSTVGINEIIFKVGFNDSAHFSRLFKKKFSCTPSEYRKKYCWLIKK